MSGAIAAVAIGAVSAAASIYTGNQQARAQKKAVARAQQNADNQAAAAEQAFNASNQKRPDTSAILDAATQAGRGGVSGTLLTGTQGVNPDILALGRNTLLGQ